MAQEIVFDARTDDERNWASWLYIAHGVSLLFTLGALSFIPLIFNYVRRPAASGTYAYSHHSWQIRSFWIYAICAVIAAVLTFTIIAAPLGWLIGFSAWIWKAYRLIRGWVALNNHEPI